MDISVIFTDLKGESEGNIYEWLGNRMSGAGMER